MKEYAFHHHTDEDFTNIGLEVAMIAQKIFDKCGASGDFAIQSPTVVGSVNRIKLTPLGWVASRNHCNDKFLSAFERMLGTRQ